MQHLCCNHYYIIYTSWMVMFHSTIFTSQTVYSIFLYVLWLSRLFYNAFLPLYSENLYNRNGKTDSTHVERYDIIRTKKSFVVTLNFNFGGLLYKYRGPRCRIFPNPQNWYWYWYWNPQIWYCSTVPYM